MKSKQIRMNFEVQMLEIGFLEKNKNKDLVLLGLDNYTQEVNIFLKKLIREGIKNYNIKDVFFSIPEEAGKKIITLIRSGSNFVKHSPEIESFILIYKHLSELEVKENLKVNIHFTRENFNASEYVSLNSKIDLESAVRNISEFLKRRDEIYFLEIKEILALNNGKALFITDILNILKHDYIIGVPKIIEKLKNERKEKIHFNGLKEIQLRDLTLKDVEFKVNPLGKLLSESSDIKFISTGVVTDDSSEELKNHLMSLKHHKNSVMDTSGIKIKENFREKSRLFGIVKTEYSISEVLDEIIWISEPY